MTGRQHFVIDVPAPPTRLKMGLAALSIGHDGFSVGTDGHIWLTALDGSTLTAHSRGPLRVISVERSIYTCAKAGVTATTDGGASIAARAGVRIIAGLGAEPSLQEPIEPIEPPLAAQALTSTCEAVASAWATVQGSIGALTAAESAGLATLSGPVTARSAVSAESLESAFALGRELSSAALDPTRFHAGEPSDISIYGLGGVNLVSPASCTIHARERAVVASPLTTQVFGRVNVNLVGHKDAGMSSLGQVDIASSRSASVVTAGPLKISSKPGETVLYGGAGVSVGQILPGLVNSAQKLTKSLRFQAKKGLRVHSPTGEVRLGRLSEDIQIESLSSVASAAIKSAALTVVDQATSSVLKDGAIAVDAHEAALSLLQTPSADPTMTLTNTVSSGASAGFVATEAITLQVGEWVVRIDKNGVTLGMAVGEPPAGKESNKPAPQAAGAQLEMKSDELTAKSGQVGASVVISSDTVELKADPLPGSIKIESDAISITDFSLVTFA